MINRESARTVSKKAPSSRRPTPRKSRDAATAPERVVFMNLAQCTNLSRAEQIGNGCVANVERVRGNIKLLLKIRRFCQSVRISREKDLYFFNGHGSSIQ